MRATVAMIATCALLAGCAMGGNYGTKVTQEQLNQLQVGTTTDTEIVSVLGKPDSITIGTGSTRQWFYHNVSWGVSGDSFIPYVGFFTGHTKTETTQVTLVLSADGVLIDMVDTGKSREGRHTDIF